MAFASRYVRPIERGRHFDPDAASVPQARQHVARLLEEGGFTGDDGLVLLLASELITNAVRHAATSFWVTAEVGERAATVSVVDDDADHAPVVGQPGPDATSGRGLLIVEQMASSWGHRPELGHGKAVWFTVE
jgi:anti-sigma regulatory factor (Ser/Thr protein kinase)